MTLDALIDVLLFKLTINEDQQALSDTSGEVMASLTELIRGDQQLKFEMMETLTQTMADKETALWLSMVMSDPQMEQLVIYCEEMVK